MGIIAQRSVEAVLFSSSGPVSVKQIKESTGLSKKEVDEALLALMHRYNVLQKSSSSLEIVEAGDKYAMQIKKAYVERGNSVAAPEIDSDLLRTLSLIAFHQPIRQSELRKMLGEKIYCQVVDLEEMNLITADPEGVTKVLSTSSYFPEYFGLKQTEPSDIKAYLLEKLSKQR